VWTRWAGATLLLLSHVPAAGQERAIEDLKHVAESRRVVRVEYCRGAYAVALGDGGIRAFREYDLAFKLDTSARGPEPGRPALVPTGRVGDRAFAVFASLEELRTTVRAACRD
jgi:hypothetical protein